MPDLTVPTIPSVPPPSTDVSVRTLASDLAALQASGGQLLNPSGESSHIAAYPINSAHPHHAGALLGWLIAILSLIAFAAVGYLGYHRLTTPAETPTPQSTTASLPVIPDRTPVSKDSLATLPQTVSVHTSKLTARTAYSLTFPFEAPSGTLKTRFQLIREALERIPPSVRIAEMTPTDADNRPLSFAGYTTLAGAPDLLSASAYSDALADDFTLLAVRDGAGFSAAYVFTLKEGQTWVYAEPSVRTIEKSTSLSSLFFTIAGSQDTAFADEKVGEYAVRTVPFFNPAGTITYGWFKNRLVITTSRQALEATLPLLCLEPDSC
jgi:hypothetical protein